MILEIKFSYVSEVLSMACDHAYFDFFPFWRCIIIYNIFKKIQFKIHLSSSLSCRASWQRRGGRLDCKLRNFDPKHFFWATCTPMFLASLFFLIFYVIRSCHRLKSEKFWNEKVKIPLVRLSLLPVSSLQFHRSIELINFFPLPLGAAALSPIASALLKLASYRSIALCKSFMK